MARQIGMKLRRREKPTDLFCKNCLEEVDILEPTSNTYSCDNCVRRYSRSQVLTFNEMIEAKFERVKHRNLNQLKRDMRP